METHFGNTPVENDLGAKRRASSDEWTSSKKRVLNSRSGSPVGANGAVDDTYRNTPKRDTSVDGPEEEDEVERFRKAAIFRRMRHYKREYGRAHERIRHLEDSLRLANLERIETETCWTNTMETIRRLMQLDALGNEIGGDSLTMAFPSRIFSPDDFKKVKVSSELKVQAAEKAINAFIRFAGKVDRPGYEELFSECQSLRQSNSFLAAEADQTHARLEDAQKSRDRLLEELQTAQIKLDRLSSHVVNTSTARVQEVQPTAKVNGMAKVEEERDSTGVRKEDTPSVIPSPKLPDEDRVDNQYWEDTLKSRDDKIADLVKENSSLKQQFITTQIKLESVGEDVVTKTPTYQALLEHASKTNALLREERLQLSRAREEITKLRRIQSKWREEMQSAEQTQIEELKLLLKKRDDDLNRIRQHREQLEAQQKELKSTHDSKRLSLIKYKELADSRGERIEILGSEVRRLKTRLAAASGDEDLLKFLQNDANLDMNYVEDIRRRLEVAETELSSLRATLKDNDRHLFDVASLRSKLESVTRQLEAFRNSDGRTLAEQLKVKDEELRVLRMKEAQYAQEMNELFSEMDRLSKAWETADKQAQAQAVSVDKWEEEKERLSLAKQKSDNKYFKAMSESEAKEAERKQALRHVERQVKQIEFHEKNEKELLTLNDSLSMELHDTRTELLRINARLESLEETKGALTRRLDEEIQQKRLLYDEMGRREKEMGELTSAQLKLKDELRKATKEAEKAMQKAKAMSSSAPASEREDELQREIDDLMKVLRCSTCQRHFRNTIITKCMHTFCKGCVDARISLRQRKCPYCNIAFAQSEVQTMYLQ